MALTTLRVYASFSQPADQRAAGLRAGDLAALRKQAAADAAASVRPAAASPTCAPTWCKCM